jgi:hypothetical protein
MNVAYINSTETSFFSEAKEQLHTMIAQLKSEDYADKEHGDIEQHIEEQGHELLRRLLQGYLEQKASREPHQKQVYNSSGESLTHVRKDTQRQLTTLFGNVKVYRKSYGQANKQSLFPMDAQLNLPEDQYSDGMRKRMSKEVIKSSFDNAIESISETTGGYIPKRQSLEIVGNVAKDFESYYEQQRFSKPEDGSSLLALSFDGKGVVMRHDSLREGTKKAAKKNKKLGGRLSPGEKKDRKRMAQVASVYSVQPKLRSAEDVMKITKDSKVLPFKPVIRNKRVWASVEREAKTVIEEAFMEDYSVSLIKALR